MLEVVLLKLKKCGFLLSLAMVICFAFPSFIKAQTLNVLQGKTGYNDFNFKTSTDFKKTPFYYLTDSGKSTNNVFSISNTRPTKVYFDLNESFDIYTYSLKVNGGNVIEWYSPIATVNFYDEKKNIIKEERRRVTNTTLIGDYPVSVEKVRYVSLWFDGGISTDYTIGVSDFGLGVFKLSEIENLKVKEEVEKVTFEWVNPKEDVFSYVKVFRDNKEFAMVDKKQNKYVAEGLKENTKYDYKFISVYADGKESKGITKSVTTKKKPLPVLNPPDNVFITPQNGKLVIAWNGVNSPHLKGYNVYVDGKKINDKPLNSTKLIVNNLENDKSYMVQISAINNDDIEGEKSKEVSEKPSSDALEVEYDVKMPFSPLDLLTSSVSLLAILGGFILLSIAIIWFRPLKELIVKAVRREKDKK